MGIAFGEPETVAYWDVFAMQSEYDRLQFDQEPHTFEKADAILEIQMPTYLNSMRLKAASMGTSDASLNRLPDIHPRAHDAAADHGDRRGRLPV